MAVAAFEYSKEIKLAFKYLKKLDEKDEYQFHRIKVFIVAEDEIMNKIEEVKYILHATFPNPEVIRRIKSKNFQLTLTLWGSFVIKAIAYIVEDEEKIQVPLSLYLDLSPYL